MWISFGLGLVALLIYAIVLLCIYGAHKRELKSQDMLFLEKNINFNDMPIEFKRGVCCYRKEVPCVDRLIGYKKEWILDKECPIFSQDRNYIEQHIQRKDS